MWPGRRPGRCQSWAEAGSSPGFGVKGQYGAPPEANFLTTFQLRLLTTFRIDASKAKSRSSRGVSGDDPDGGAGVASTAARNRGYETPGAAAGHEIARRRGAFAPHPAAMPETEAVPGPTAPRWSAARRRPGCAGRPMPRKRGVAPYERDLFKAGASRRSAAPRFGGGYEGFGMLRDDKPGRKIRAAGRKKLRCLTS